MRLVVDNAPQPAPPEPPSDAELRLAAQAALVRAAKKSPLRAVVILDLGGGEVATLTAGLDRDAALRLAGAGVRDMQHHL